MTNKSLMIVFMFGLVGASASSGVWWFYLAKKTAVAAVSRPIPVEIAKGTSTRQVANQLARSGIIHSPWAFIILVKLKGTTVKAGQFILDPSQPLEKIASQVVVNQHTETTITIPEGWRSEQIAQRLFDKKLIAGLDSFIDRAKGHEGYLFPDTYQFSTRVSQPTIIDRLRENFQIRTKGLNLTKENVIIASIVEREAKHDEDRAKMAGVFKNRLEKGLALEADPTVQYSIDSSAFAKLPESEKLKYQFWGLITLNQAKTFESPYNTYRKPGLPPGPISNPGLKSLAAAVQPEKHDYFYFFNLPDGTTIYSKTLDEHNANKLKHGFGR